MPGFDGSGPRGMGSMTGGARGLCNPYGRDLVQRSPMSQPGWSGGRGRGYRNRYWATGLPGWMRSGPTGPTGASFAAPYTREQEMGSLKEQAAFLKDELDAINSRLRDIESEGK
ncbi:MAG: DUF5320 domain-containing protein [Deltaproteobacteria bacterium]|nr:DUF5320 domain-containing protein [Deltaproteobacteria bacterium]